MSTIGNYVRGLIPSFERNSVSDDIRNLRTDLMENTIPPFAEMALLYKGNAFSGKETKVFDTTFMRAVKVDKVLGKNYIEVVSNSLVRTAETLQHIQDNLEQYFGKEIATAGITYGRANVLQYIDVIHFANRYARKLLLWTLNEEQSSKGSSIATPFTKAEVQWLFANRNAFFNVVRILSIKTTTFTSMIKTIPNIVVVPDEEVIHIETVGSEKLDPLRMGFLPSGFNFVLGIRKVFAEWQVAAYKAGQEEKRLLEFRILALKEANSGNKDAKLEQQIEYSQDRLKKLNFKLAKMEEE